MNKSIAILLSIVLAVSCAQPGSPTGGPKDVEPPLALTAEPENGSILFNSKRIEVEFNEYLTLKNVSQELLVSPPLSNDPDIYTKKKSLIIDLEGALRDNTTYTFNFGNAITDLTEGNAAETFKYVFSTGEYIDSLTIQGVIRNAFTGQPSAGFTVLLFGGLDTVSIPLDSLPARRRPDYAGRTNENGEFLLDYLRDDEYRLFAVADGNRNYLYDLPSEEIAFLPDPISAGDTNIISLRSFISDPDPQFLRARQISAVSIGFYTLGGLRPDVTPLPSNPLDTFFTVPGATDTLIGFLRPDHGYDSLLFLVESDTVLDTALVSWRVRDIPETPWTLTPSTGVWNTFDTLALKNALPIDFVDPSKFKISADSAEIPSEFQKKDAFNVQGNIDRVYGKSYVVQVLPGAAGTVRDTLSDTLTAVLNFPIKEDLGQLNVLWKLPAEKAVFLELLSEKNVVLYKKSFAAQASEKEEITTFPDLPPGSYRLRLVDDSNGNGRWDPGNYWTKANSEFVYYSETMLNVRANWELDYELLLKNE